MNVEWQIFEIMTLSSGTFVSCAVIQKKSPQAFKLAVVRRYCTATRDKWFARIVREPKKILHFIDLYWHIQASNELQDYILSKVHTSHWGSLRNSTPPRMRWKYLSRPRRHHPPGEIARQWKTLRRCYPRLLLGMTSLPSWQKPTRMTRPYPSWVSL